MSQREKNGDCRRSVVAVRVSLTGSKKDAKLKFTTAMQSLYIPEFIAVGKQPTAFFLGSVKDDGQRMALPPDYR